MTTESARAGGVSFKVPSVDDRREGEKAEEAPRRSQVICLTSGFLVTVSATSGRQITSWITSGSCPHASRHLRTPPKNQAEDQATCSEHLMTHELPAKREASSGESRLWNE